MGIIKRITALLLSLATVGTISFSSTVKADAEKYDSWLDFNKDQKTVSGIPLGAKAENFAAEVKNSDGDALSDKATVSTGCVIKKDGESYTVIVLGDVNGDGQINSTDFMQVRRHFLGLYTIPEEKQDAADVNGDGNVNSTDFMQVRRHFLGLFNLYA